MSDHGKKAMHCLLEGQGAKLDNLKFARGTDAVISEDRLYEVLCESVDRRAQHSDALSDYPPRCANPALDLREWVASI